MVGEPEKRKEREKLFHNEVFAQEDIRDPTRKYYTVVECSWRQYEALLKARQSRTRVLEYGCGPGSYAFFMSARGLKVTGIDISETAINRARARCNTTGNIPSFAVMDAEALGLRDGMFDLICGRAILHHLDLDRSLAEIGRVLKKDGHAIFVEPLGHNPLINWYRNRTPAMRTVDEHPLLLSDLKKITGAFQSSKIQHFHFLSLATVPFRGMPGYRRLVRFFDAMDQAVFRCLPFTRRLAWTVIIELNEPRKGSAADQVSLAGETSRQPQPSTA